METVRDLINRYQEITLVTHINPDGDAIGSLFGLQLGLEQLGKVVTCVLKDPVPQVFSFLPPPTRLVNEFPRDNSLCIALDMNDASRSGFLPEMMHASKECRLVTVDHHPKGDLTRLSVAITHEETASSTAELVYKLLVSLEVRFTAPMTTCLLTGIYTDTGGFQYPNTTTETLEVAAELMRRGAKLNTISRYISRSKTVSGLKLLGIALERLRLARNNTCAISVLTTEDMTQSGALSEDIGGIIGEINVLPSVGCSILLCETEPGIIRGTLRTGEGHKINVSQLAKLLGGGGHPRAAGFTLKGHLSNEANDQTWQVSA